VNYAKGILQKELLPHVGTEPHCEPRKVYFLGYACHKLLMCRLGRLSEDDRDHFGKKRLDMAGPLLGGLFRMLLRKLTKDVRGNLQRALDSGKHFNIQVSEGGGREETPEEGAGQKRCSVQTLGYLRPTRDARAAITTESRLHQLLFSPESAPPPSPHPSHTTNQSPSPRSGPRT